ncbi:tyrosine-type recombinase/integrase [Candidatus Palauibacter sp.]|uniref:tyrosine-type recombinase/integrase n=1 Tax=Candidatus Palauibacter sp. TaxID=3101350 RepID=UPI003CC65DAE
MDLPDLHASYAAGVLDHAIEERRDPPLRRAAAMFLAANRDPRYRRAVAVALEIAPTGARASWLLDPSNLARLLRHYRTRGLAPATERREMTGIGVWIREQFGETERVRAFGEIALRPIRRRGGYRYLGEAEIARLRVAAGDWWLVIALALATGIRRGELLALLRRSVDEGSGALVVESGKSDAARRRVPFGGEALALVRDWVSGQPLDPAGPLFPGLTAGKLRGAWTGLRAAAGLSEVRWHDLRHTYGVHCAAGGMPLPELQNRMGHSTIQQTMEYAEYAPPERSRHYDRALDSMGLAGSRAAQSSANPSASHERRRADVA